MNQTKAERNTHIDKANTLSIYRQCELLEVCRSSFYYKALSETELNLKLMRLIDEEYMKHRWLGVPRMTSRLGKDMNIRVNKKRIERRYRLMGLCAIGSTPNTSKTGKGKHHNVFSYLLKNLNIKYPNHVWAMDITYIPVQGGYLYLCAMIDLYSRFVVGWSLSNTMTSEWCRQTLEEAIHQHGSPEILNTDQGSPFTATDCSNWGTAAKQGITLSMDGKARAIDHIFIERLWRSVTYEHVYLTPADNGLECYKGLKDYFVYYNTQRRPQSLDDQKPITVYQQTQKQVA
jgi:putative transposase